MNTEKLITEAVNQFESELVDEICQKFEAIGIDTSEWQYKFGDGKFAAEFIQAGIKDHLEKLTASQSLSTPQVTDEEIERMAEKILVKHQPIFSDLKQTVARKDKLIEAMVEMYKASLKEKDNVASKSEFNYSDDQGPFKIVVEGHYWKKVRPKDNVAGSNAMSSDSCVTPLYDNKSIEQ